MVVGEAMTQTVKLVDMIPALADIYKVTVGKNYDIVHAEQSPMGNDLVYVKNDVGQLVGPICAERFV